MDKLRGLVHCSLCDQRFQEPKALPVCLHTFCKVCLQDYIADYDDNGSFKCPVCQSNAKKPIDVSLFPTNNLVLQLLDIISDSAPTNGDQLGLIIEVAKTVDKTTVISIKKCGQGDIVKRPEKRDTLLQHIRSFDSVDHNQDKEEIEHPMLCRSSEVFASGLCIFLNGDIAVAHHSNGHVKIFDSEGRFKRFIEIPDRSMRVWDLLALPDGRMVASYDSGDLFLFDANGRFCAHIEGDFGEKSGLSLNWSRRELVLTNGSHGIAFVSLCEEANFRVVRRHLKHWAFPRYVATDSKGTSYVSCLGSRNLMVLDYSFQTLNVISELKKAENNGSDRCHTLKWPAGVAIDNNGNVYLADHAEDTVYRLSPDGSTVTVVLQGKGIVEGPQALAISPDGVLYVLQRNGVVKQFAIQRQWSTTLCKAIS